MLKSFIALGNVLYNHPHLILLWMASSWSVAKLIHLWSHEKWPDAKIPVGTSESSTLSVWALILGIFFTGILRPVKRIQIMDLLKRPNFPKGFLALEMLWPKQLREEVWHPAFYDAQATHIELREQSWLPMLNLIFTLKMIHLVIVTGRIAFLDWSVSKLTNRRARLTGRATIKSRKIE